MFCTQCGASIHPGAPFCARCGAATATHATSFSPATPPVTRPQFVGFWYRVLAWLIDTVLCQISGLVVVMLLAFAQGVWMAGSDSTAPITLADDGLGLMVGVLSTWLWFTLFESSTWQATPGKKMLGMKVTDEHGQPLGFGRANVRYWSKILSGLIIGIGYVMVAFTQKKQGLHDLIAHTLIVKAHTIAHAGSPNGRPFTKS